MSDNQTEFSDLKVMVIDDSKTIRRSAETLLKKAGCEVLTAENGLFDRAKGRVVGAEEYLTKPFTREDLLGAIRTHLLSKEADAAPLSFDIE